MSDLLQQQQLPQSQLDHEMKQNEQDQNAMWDSVALAALTEDDDDQTTRNRAKDSEHNENDQGDNGIVLATSSDIGSVQSNANGIQDMNNLSNSSNIDAFGEYLSNRIFSNTCHCVDIFGSHKIIFRMAVPFICYVLSNFDDLYPSGTTKA